MMKNVKNWKNSENGKIEMGPFGTLYEPPGSRKKCSKQLRSRSIDRSCQMVCTGTIKLKNGSVCLSISGPVSQRVIVDG